MKKASSYLQLCHPESSLSCTFRGHYVRKEGANELWQEIVTTVDTGRSIKFSDAGLNYARFD